MLKLVEAVVYFAGALLLAVALATPLFGEPPLARIGAHITTEQFQWLLTGGSILFLLVTASAAALLGRPALRLRRSRRHR